MFAILYNLNYLQPQNHLTWRIALPNHALSIYNTENLKLLVSLKFIFSRFGCSYWEQRNSLIKPKHWLAETWLQLQSPPYPSITIDSPKLMTQFCKQMAKADFEHAAP